MLLVHNIILKEWKLHKNGHLNEVPQDIKNNFKVETPPSVTGRDRSEKVQFLKSHWVFSHWRTFANLLFQQLITG